MRIRWDNPVAMPCTATCSVDQAFRDHYGGSPLCGAESCWIWVDGDGDALAFRCHRHRGDEPVEATT